MSIKVETHPYTEGALLQENPEWASTSRLGWVVVDERLGALEVALQAGRQGVTQLLQVVEMLLVVGVEQCRERTLRVEHFVELTKVFLGSLVDGLSVDDEERSDSGVRFFAKRREVRCLFDVGHGYHLLSDSDRRT